MKPNDLLAELRRLVDKPLDTVPPGYKTSVQFAAEWKMCRGRSEILLKRGVKAGLLDVKVLRVLAGSTARKVFHYAAKKPRG